MNKRISPGTSSSGSLSCEMRGGSQPEGIGSTPGKVIWSQCCSRPLLSAWRVQVGGKQASPLDVTRQGCASSKREGRASSEEAVTGHLGAAFRKGFTLVDLTSSGACLGG